MLSEEKDVKLCYSKFSRPLLEEPITVRIKFCKIGNLQFISHLDLQRTFHRILVRSGIPMWYTKGFNPHAKLVFGLPLSVGTESMCEFADLKIERDISLDEIVCQLNKNLTNEMYVLEAYIPTRKFADICYADYTISINSYGIGGGSAEDVCSLFSAPVFMQKRSKSGEHEVDITKYIHSLKVFSENGKMSIHAILKAGNTESINPEYLMTAIKQNCGFMDEALKPSYRIMRNTVYDAQMIEFK